jgi:hypothetical protein
MMLIESPLLALPANFNHNDLPALEHREPNGLDSEAVARMDAAYINSPDRSRKSVSQSGDASHPDNADYERRRMNFDEGNDLNQDG